MQASFIKIFQFIGILFFFTIAKTEITVLGSLNLFNIVDKEYKHCSPLQGMVWWKSNLIENMYRIGNSTDAIIRFLKLLFYLHEDGTFDCTRKPKIIVGSGNSAAYLTPEIIAELIYLLEKNKTIELINILKQEITKKSYIKKFLGYHKNIFPETGNFTKNLKKFFSLFCESYKECLSSVYEKHTLHNILLAYIWKQSMVKENFIDYFNVFEKPDFSLPIINQENKIYLNSLASTSYEPDLLKAFFVSLPYKSLYEILGQYELVICSFFYNKASVLLPTEGQVYYKEESFADCGEILILNFFNLLIFNVKTELFDIELLPKKGLALDPKLVKFYQEYNRADLMSKRGAHDDWAKVVSGIPNVSYRQPYRAESENKYCNIAGIGYHQLITVFNHLLGLAYNKDTSNTDQLENIASAFSRENFKLTYKFSEPTDSLYNTIIFFINNKASFACDCKDSHFLLYPIGVKVESEQTLSLEAIDWLIYNCDAAISNSLLVINKGFAVLDKFIKNRVKTLSLLNFAVILPKIDSVESKKDFLKIISNNYSSLKKVLTKEDLLRLTNIIKNICLDKSFNYLVLNGLMKIVIFNKIESLYPFIKDKIEQFSSTKDNSYYSLIVDIIVKIDKYQNSNLYEWIDQLMSIIKDTKYFFLAEALVTKL